MNPFLNTNTNNTINSNNTNNTNNNTIITNNTISNLTSYLKSSFNKTKSSTKSSTNDTDTFYDTQITQIQSCINTDYNKNSVSNSSNIFNFINNNDNKNTKNNTVKYTNISNQQHNSDTYLNYKKNHDKRLINTFTENNKNLLEPKILPKNIFDGKKSLLRNQFKEIKSSFYSKFPNHLDYFDSFAKENDVTHTFLDTKSELKSNVKIYDK